MNSHRHSRSRHRHSRSRRRLSRADRRAARAGKELRRERSRKGSYRPRSGRERTRLRSHEASRHDRRRSRTAAHVHGDGHKVKGKMVRHGDTQIVQTNELYVESHPTIASTLRQLEAYVDKLLEKGVRKPAAVFDIDETVLQYVEKRKGDEASEYARTIQGMREFLAFLRRRGVAIRFITARRERGRKDTLEDMERLGLWQAGDSLFMKPDHFPSRSSSLAKHMQREQVSKDMGHTIIINVGDQVSDMLPRHHWKWFVEAVLKLPDCRLKRAMEESCTKSSSICSILEDCMGRFSNHLLFLYLENDVAVSLKLANTKWYTV